MKLELTHNTMEKEAEAVQKVVDQLEEKYAQMIATHTELRQGYIALVGSLSHAPAQCGLHPLPGPASGFHSFFVRPPEW